MDSSSGALCGGCYNQAHGLVCHRCKSGIVGGAGGGGGGGGGNGGDGTNTTTVITCEGKHYHTHCYMCLVSTIV